MNLFAGLGSADERDRALNFAGSRIPRESAKLIFLSQWQFISVSDAPR